MTEIDSMNAAFRVRPTVSGRGLCDIDWEVLAQQNYSESEFPITMKMISDSLSDHEFTNELFEFA